MSLVESHTADGVCVLRLNRPERRNALSGALIEALLEALAAAADDAECRAVVLTGNGKSFCAGGDLADGLGGDGFVAAHQGRGRFVTLMQALRGHRVPVVAAVNGDAMGGGCGLASGCDLVVMDAGARMGTPEINLGLFPWIILASLQRDVPRKRLLEMVLTGEKLSAEQALDLGLVNRVVPSGTAVEEATALAMRIANRAPLAVSMGKAAFHHIADQSYDDALAFMHTQLSINLLTEDAMEGVAAFLQRREPEWKGR